METVRERVELHYRSYNLEKLAEAGKAGQPSQYRDLFCRRPRFEFLSPLAKIR